MRKAVVMMMRWLRHNLPTWLGLKRDTLYALEQSPMICLRSLAFVGVVHKIGLWHSHHLSCLLKRYVRCIISPGTKQSYISTSFMPNPERLQ